MKQQTEKRGKRPKFTTLNKVKKFIPKYKPAINKSNIVTYDKIPISLAESLQTDKYMMFLLVVAKGSSLLHCSMHDFSKVNETGIKVVSSYPSGHVEVRCPSGKKTYQ